MAKAFERVEGWTFHSACNPNAVLPYLEYPVDVPWDMELIRALYADADVFHARNDWSTYEQLAGMRRIPAVIHYHGTNFRILNAQRLREQKEHAAQGIVSTLDLWLIAPDRLEWLPSPYDLEMLSGLRSRVLLEGTRSASSATGL